MDRAAQYTKGRRKGRGGATPPAATAASLEAAAQSGDRSRRPDGPTRPVRLIHLWILQVFNPIPLSEGHRDARSSRLKRLSFLGGSDENAQNRSAEWRARRPRVGRPGSTRGAHPRQFVVLARLLSSARRAARPTLPADR